MVSTRKCEMNEFVHQRIVQTNPTKDSDERATEDDAGPCYRICVQGPISRSQPSRSRVAEPSIRSPSLAWPRLHTEPQVNLYLRTTCMADSLEDPQTTWHRSTQTPPSGTLVQLGLFRPNGHLFRNGDHIARFTEGAAQSCEETFSSKDTLHYYITG